MKNKPQPANRWLIFFFVAIGVFMSTLDGSIVNVALPSIMADLSTSMAIIEWVPMIYLLTVSSLLLSFGRLSDIKGRRWVYSRGLFVFSVGSLFCATAPDAWWLIAARTFQGLGAAMIMACTPALVIDTFPPRERGKAMGMIGTVVASGLTVGPALGGWIVQAFSWQMIFYINIPIGMAAAYFVNRMLKGGNADVTRKEAFDIKGALLLTFFLAPLLVTISHGYKTGYTSLTTVILAGVSMVSAIGLAMNEHGAAQPVIDTSILKIRMFILPVLSAVILFMSLFIITFLMPFFLMQPYGLNVKDAGHLMVTPFLCLFLISPFSGRMYDRIGSRLLCTIGFSVLALSLVLFSRIDAASPIGSVIGCLALAGTGTAIFIAPNSAAAMGAVPKSRLGIAAAMVATARNLGMVFGITTAATLFNSTFYHLSGGRDMTTYHPGMEPIFMAAFQRAMTAGAFIAGLGMLVAFIRGKENLTE